MVVGRITRGTTGTNRLRRADRWLAAHPLFRANPKPLVVDLGFGAAPHTTLELADRLLKVNPATRVVGIEIDNDRVLAALPSANEQVSFRRGGFEIPLGGKDPDIVRAFNVLRQYEEEELPEIWELLRSRLAPGGLLIDGTCDEIGRVATWVGVTETGPQTFTVSLRLAQLETPAIAAERLVKALIHRNVAGESIHRFLSELEKHWQHAAPLQVYSPVQRWLATVRSMRENGWSVLDGPTRWRLGEITVPWVEVAPLR